ncbi:MAG: gamma-glutamyltransferase [Pirellulales bacterium]
MGSAVLTLGRPAHGPLIWLAGVLLSLLPANAAEKPTMVEAAHGVVVSVSAPASDVGRSILQRGGNAVDAAVATAFALAVTHPAAGNIGGGGFMMIHPGAGAEPVCVEYRETAPAAATKTMFQLGESHLGHKAVGVPGTVRGLELAHRRFGKLPWHELVVPAVRLARDGFPVDRALARSLNEAIGSDDSASFAELRRVLAAPDGLEWRAGNELVQPELARTLARIADGGPAAFYEGVVADLIVAEMKAGGGLIAKNDLAAYRAKIRKPIHTTYRRCDVYGPPPPSSGGICLAEMLNILEPFELRDHRRWSAKTVHLMIEAMRRAYLDRARHLGDPDFTEIPPHLPTKRYAAELAGQINLGKATRSADLAKEIPLAPEGESTTHFSVIDSDGMGVSNTYTLETSYGSRVVVRGAGFLLNNEMGDFNWKPGHTDHRGNIGTEANQIAPGKRMLSSQTPTIVARDGNVLLLTGSPGGRTIINTSLCVTLNMLEFQMDLATAVEAPRLHHQWLPDRVRFEGTGDPRFRTLVEQLRQMGHEIEDRPRRQGDAHSIWVDPGTGKAYGVADPRTRGKAAAY